MEQVVISVAFDKFLTNKMLGAESPTLPPRCSGRESDSLNLDTDSPIKIGLIAHLCANKLHEDNKCIVPLKKYARQGTAVKKQQWHRTCVLCHCLYWPDAVQG